MKIGKYDDKRCLFCTREEWDYEILKIKRMFLEDKSFDMVYVNDGEKGCYSAFFKHGLDRYFSDLEELIENSKLPTIYYVTILT